MPDAGEAVVVERHESVATVVLNRPGAHNALNRGLKDGLLRALNEVADDSAVRAVVLTGEGKSFCVGQDLSEHAEALERGAFSAFDTVIQHYTPIVTALATMPKPVIAAVNGTCVGAGLGFALACDLRVLASEATLLTAFTSIGLTCDSGLSMTLARAVGDARARELILLDRSFSAQEAVSWGITGDVMEAGQVRGHAQKLAATLAAGPTRAYAEAKTAVSEAWTMTLADALDAEAAAQARAGATRDHAAAVQAFLAKERPEFEGR